MLRELQRRKVLRAAAVYLVAAWLLLQIAATIAPILSLPDWFEELVLALLLIAFPIALILAWSLELTPEGVRAESSPGSNQAARVLDYSVLVILLIGLAWFAVDRFGADKNYGTLELDKSVAILPFINLNNDNANAAFTAGIHADLLTQLARIKSVRTVSRTTVLKYRESAMTVPEIAAELGVATIVEGGVQRAGNSVRVNVQLIDAAADRPL